MWYENAGVLPYRMPPRQNQFEIVKGLLQREDVEEIYNAGDSGREGEYIQTEIKENPRTKQTRYCSNCGRQVFESDAYCPSCGNRDHDKLNVARRTCGYIGTNFWNKGRTQEIKERVLHL